MPYLFADARRTGRSKPTAEDPLTETQAYKAYLVAIATVPALGMVLSFEQVQLFYAVCGAMFVPLLAVVLLYLNSRAGLVGSFRTRPLGLVALVITLGFFAWFGLAKYI